MRNEPLIEIKQLKGTSETHPLLSPNDEFASFELMSVLLGNPPGRIPHIVGSYARQALKDGLAMQDTEGFNPYKFGFGAASDSHNTAVPYRQDNFFGGHSFTDGTIEARMSGTLVGGMFDARTEGTGGLTGVWAEENTRASLFDAMQRKETFAVSGPHIKVRLFGGWEYTAAMLADKDWVKTGYAKGVPMGGDLPPAKGKAPTFIVWAVKDPTSGNLDRIQIVKGWTKSGQSFEKIFDVVWAGDRKPDKWTGVVPPIGSTVDVEKATYTNTIGAVELKTVWTDPEFDPSLHAFYYARVLEIPTPRWTTIQAAKLGIAPPDVVAATLQERAWSSPIWYTPSAEARKSAKPGTTVADLKKQGAVALNDAQLKALIVREVGLAAEHGDRRQVHDHLRRARQGRGREAAHARRARLRHAAVPRQPGPVPGALRGKERGDAEPDRRRGPRPAISAPPGPTPSTTGRSSPSSSARRSRSPSTSWATSTSARAATSSATPTTRSSRQLAELSPLRERSASSAPAMACGRLLREPLLQFLLLGRCCSPAITCLQSASRSRAAAVAPHRADRGRSAPDPHRVARAGRVRRPAEEMQRLVESRVREEILYREALALGLDKDDTIVKRRLAQKMEFLFEDVAALREPTADELKAWFAKNAERFTLPARATFRHLYFSPDRRGARARDGRGAGAREARRQAADSPEATALADPFMFQDYYGDRTPDEVAKTFGPAFAQALFQLTPGAWAGPIESGYGWHLVWVDSLTPARVPAFEEVEPDVKTAWLGEKSRSWEKAYKAMRAKYEVVLPAPPAPEKGKP